MALLGQGRSIQGPGTVQKHLANPSHGVPDKSEAAKQKLFANDGLTCMGKKDPQKDHGDARRLYK